MFLTPDELKQMTGAREKARQEEWLKSVGIPYTKSYKGNLNVSRKAVEIRHGGEEGTNKPAWEPDRDFFRRKANAS